MESTHYPLSKRTWTGIILGALVSLGTAIWFQLIRDEPPRMPPGYVLPDFPPPVSDADNGLVYLDAEVAKETWPEIESGKDGHTGIIGWREPWDEEKMRPLVEAAPAMRAIVDKALSYPGWRTESGPGTRLFYKPVELACKILLAKVRQLVEANDTPAAIEWQDLMFRLAQRQQESPISLADAMIAAGTWRTMQASLMRVLARSGSNDATLARGSAMLESPTARREDIMRGIALDYRRETARYFNPTKNPNLKLGGLFGLIGGKDVPEWLIKSRFKPEAFHNLVLQHIALLDRLTKTTGRGRLQELRAARGWLEEESKLSVWSFEPNRAGRILAASYGGFFKPVEAMIFGDAYRQCCRAAIAAKRWSLAHRGEPVPTLADLVPRYLSAVPLDPYDGQPLKWDSVTGTAYVIGPDGVNNLPDFKPGEVSGFGEKGTGVRLP